MSTLAVNTITNAAGGNTAQINGMTPTADSLQGFRNRILNGGMVIDQRNAGASVATTTTGTGVYTLDRWLYLVNAASKMTIQQNAGSVTPPVGFSNYLGITSTSAYTVGSSEQFSVQQNIEGFNFADVSWGTANAQPVTLSFWVRSSLTGTFSVVLKNSAANRSYPAAYTINAANTWEQKTITVAGDTSGTWVGATNGVGLRLYITVGSGSSLNGTSGAWAGADYYGATGTTSVVGTSGATFYITGVQLEAGAVATPFERRPFGAELALCQRYYWKPVTEPIGLAATGFGAGGRLNNPVPMRAAATISGATFTVNVGTAGTVTSLFQTVNGQVVYNSANNWTLNATVSVNGEISAEL